LPAIVTITLTTFVTPLSLVPVTLMKNVPCEGEADAVRLRFTETEPVEGTVN